MRKTSLISLLFLLGFFPAFAFAEATSTSFIVESEQAVAGGGRQSSDSFTNIGTVGGGMIATRATSTSFTADVSTAFWNAAHTGTLTVTDTSDVSATAAFTLSYASADPESPLFMACYGTVQADVESSCTGTATRALTGAFSYRFSGLTNNTTYYFRVYPLSGYDDAGNPIISPYYSATASASRTVSDVFTPISGGSGSGGGTSSGGNSGVVQVASDDSPTPVGIVDRVMAFLGFASPPPTPLQAGGSTATALPRLAPSSAQGGSPSVGVGKDSFTIPTEDISNTPSAFIPAPVAKLFAVRGTVMDTVVRAGVPSVRVTVYACPSPVARIAGCSVLGGKPLAIAADFRGQFTISVPVGIYRLRAEARGYDISESEAITITNSGKSVAMEMRRQSLWRRIFGW